LADLGNPASYKVEPTESWRRIKARIQSKKQQAVLMKVAAWREREAQMKDVPRGRIIKDDALGEIAIQMPGTREALMQLRLLPRGSADSVIGKGILGAVAEAQAMNPAEIPSPKGRGDELTPAQEAIAEVLKLALKVVSERANIAPKLLASTSDIEAMAVDDSAKVDAMHGWRLEVFGKTAIDLKHGRAVLGIEKGRAAILPRPI
jgi:ribonuclease D